jgi:hypothetical protein
VLGADASDDTFEEFSKAASGAKNKAYCAYVNSRLAKVPSNVTLHVLEWRSREKDTTSFRKDLTGLFKVAKSVSRTAANGTYNGGFWKLHWFHVPKANQITGTYKSGELGPNHRAVAIALRSKESDDLLEIYELHTGNTALRMLDMFGLTPLASEMMLVLELVDPDQFNISSNISRTALAQKGQPVDYRPFATVFKEQMPDELRELISAALAAKSVGTVEAKVQAAFADLATVLAQPQPKPTPNAHGAGGNGAKSHPGAATPSDDPKHRQPTQDGGPGSGPGGQATPVHDPTGASQTSSPGPIVPKVLDWEAAVGIPEDEVNYFAKWEADSFTLLINDDFPGLATELASHHRPAFSDPEFQEAARQIIKAELTLCVADAIVGQYLLHHANPVDTNWELGLEPQALTNAVLPSKHRHQRIATQITEDLGGR